MKTSGFLLGKYMFSFDQNIDGWSLENSIHHACMDKGSVFNWISVFQLQSCPVYTHASKYTWEYMNPHFLTLAMC